MCVDVYSASLLAAQSVVFLQEVLADELNGIVWFVFCQLLKGLNQVWHDVLVEVLADGQLRVDGLLIFVHLVLAVTAIGRVCYHSKNKQMSTFVTKELDGPALRSCNLPSILNLMFNLYNLCLWCRFLAL